MTTYQGTSGRKLSGGRLVKSKGKKKRELGNSPAHTHIADEVRKRKVSAAGNNFKFKLYRAKTVNVTDITKGKTVTVDIDSVSENSASKEFRRRNIITKGAILKTKKGNVKVTNRPGQEGHVNGIFIK